MIIDTNALQSEELWAFLSISADNAAVLPDYVLMEAFKPGRIEGLQARFSILRQFPEQVLALRATGEVSLLDPGSSDLPDAMIEPEETAAFPAFCAQITRAGDNLGIAAALDLRAQWAQEHLATMLAGLSDMATAMAEFRAPFTKAELARIRRNESYTPAMADKFFNLFVQMAETAFAMRPDVPQPSLEHRPQHFIFRNALCYAVYMVSRIRAGAVDRKASLARNDSVDVLLATYGTYFDGVMSQDALTNEVHDAAWRILGNLQVATGRHYVSDYMMQVVDFLEAQDHQRGSGS